MKKPLRFLLPLLLSVCCLFGLVSPVLAADSSGPKLAAITFDDGPGAYTQTLLDGLAEYNVKATFFIAGYRVQSFPGLLEKIAEGGHQLGNHTYNHNDLNSLGAQSIASELSSNRNLLVDAAGEQTYYIRPPYGNANATVRAQADAPLINWSVDTLDWKTRNAEAVKNAILNDTYDGAIVLLHDIHKTSVEGVLAAIPILLERGYELVTVEQLLYRRGIQPQAGVIYYDAKNTGINLPADSAGPGYFDESQLQSHWAYSELQLCLRRGYLEYDEQGRVLPNQPITRADFALALGRFCGISDNYVRQAEGSYLDVDRNDRRLPYIDWAFDVCLMGGYNGYFRPNDRITREDVATVIARYLVMRGLSQPGGSLDGYSDAGNISDWAVDGVRLCTKLGILAGNDRGRMMPKASMTRAEAAAILTRLGSY